MKTLKPFYYKDTENNYLRITKTTKKLFLEAIKKENEKVNNSNYEHINYYSNIEKSLNCNIEFINFNIETLNI